MPHLSKRAAVAGLGLAALVATTVGVTNAVAGTSQPTVHCADAVVAADGTFSLACTTTQPTSTTTPTSSPTTTAPAPTPTTQAPTPTPTTSAPSPSATTSAPSPTATTSSTPTATPTAAGSLVKDGELGFDVGGVPHGSNGKACNTGAADGPDATADQYGSVQEMGNTACTNQVSFTSAKTRNARSAKSMKIVMGANQQREYAQSKFAFTPDAKGTVDQWYGFSMYYDPADWKLSELSGSQWDDPFSWRTQGANGSLNLSSDTNDSDSVSGQTVHNYSTPHFSLRRNTVLNQSGFYKDGKGLDKIDLGPVVLGKWMDFVVHVRWSTTSTNAVREAWRDGVYMGKKTTLNAVDTNVHHIRVGQYQATNIPHARTSYFDNVRVGTSYAAVDPSK